MGGVDRRHAGVTQVLLAVGAEIGAHHELAELLASPRHRGLGELLRHLHAVHGREVEHAVEQQRGARSGRVVREGGGHRGGEVAAGAVAAHGEPARVTPPAARLLRGPAHRREAVFERGGEGVLGREAVVDVEDQLAGLREAAGELAVCAGAAADPTSPV
jgi:hypothetical protein